jgi:hypothetical protein
MSAPLSTSLPITAVSAVVLVGSLLVTAAWLFSVYR